MAQRRIYLPELTAHCIAFVDAVSNKLPVYAPFYRVAYTIGCRFKELTQITNFERISKKEIEFQPAKGNKKRLLDATILPTEFGNMVNSQISYFDRLNYEAHRRYFRQFWPGYPIYYPQFAKPVSFYCFRYRYIWQMAADGHSSAAIAEDMGEVEITNITNYIQQPLMVWEPDLPPIKGK